MMGDFDWEEINVVGRYEAFCWFATFNIVVVLLMLNMLLAIVMNAYDSVKQSLGKAETLWAELQQGFNRWVGQRKGLIIPLTDVLAALKNRTPDPRGRPGAVEKGGDEDEDEDIIITMDWMKGRLPSMPSAQMVDLLKNAAQDFYDENKEDADIDEMLQLTRKVKYRTMKLKRRANAVKEGSKKPSGASPGKEGPSGSIAGAASEAVQVEEAQHGEILEGSFEDELAQCQAALAAARDLVGKETLEDILVPAAISPEDGERPVAEDL